MLLTGLHVRDVINFYLTGGKLFTIKKKKNKKKSLYYIEKFPFVVKIGKIRVNYNRLINLLQEGRTGRSRDSGSLGFTFPEFEVFKFRNRRQGYRNLATNANLVS